MVFGSSEKQAGPQEEYHLFVDAFRRLRVELQMIGDDDARSGRSWSRAACPSRASPPWSSISAWPSARWGSGSSSRTRTSTGPPCTGSRMRRRGRASPICWPAPASWRIPSRPITENVQLAPRGGALTAPSRTGLGTDRLARVLGNMSDEADYVLMDSSPILLIPGQPLHGRGGGRHRARRGGRPDAAAGPAADQGDPGAGRHADHRRRPEPDAGEASRTRYYKQYSGYYGA